jgi:hypothetical protein
MAALQSKEWRVHRESRSGLNMTRSSLTSLRCASKIAAPFLQIRQRFGQSKHSVAQTQIGAQLLRLRCRHFHPLVCPLKDREAKITQFSAGLKRFVRSQTQATWKWQDGVFDRLLRKDEFAESKWFYIRENPVRAGLVERWEGWPYLIDYGEL